MLLRATGNNVSRPLVANIDQIIIEAKDFLTAIETGEPVWPTFQEGMEVNRVIAAAWASSDSRAWVNIKDF